MEALVKQVVVVGGGFGGIAAARALLKGLPEGWRVVLVSEKDQFTFKPLLHEAATGAFGAEVVSEPIEKNLKGSRFEFIKAHVSKVDLKQQSLYCSKNKKILFDCLVIATGSLTNFYGVQGAEENCFKLESVEDALAVRKQVALLFSSSQKNSLTFVVVGAGPTGVEFSAELSEFALQMSRRYRKAFDLVVVDRSQTVLPNVSAEFRSRVMRLIQREKIRLLAGATATNVGKGFVVVESSAGRKRINCDMAVWAAGIKPSELKFKPKIGKSRGFLVVDSSLHIPGFSNVFAVGDCALAKNPDGRTVPWLAQAAVQEGKAAANNIIAAVNGKPQRRFAFRQKGFILPVGRSAALADVSLFGRSLFFDGFFAWWLNRTIYLASMLSLKHKIKVAWLWTLGLFRERAAV